MLRHSAHVSAPEHDESVGRLLVVLDGLADALAGGGWRDEREWAALWPDSDHTLPQLLPVLRSVIESDVESIWFERLDADTARVTWSGCHSMPGALEALLEAFGVRILVGADSTPRMLPLP